MSIREDTKDEDFSNETSSLSDEVTAVKSQDYEVENETAKETPLLTESSETNEELLNASTAELTVENLQRYEKETNPYDVEELIFKQGYDNVVSMETRTNFDQQQSPLKLVPTLVLPTSSGIPRISISPSQKLVTKGLKLTGEEYEAVSIDIQTDESWLVGSQLFVQEIIEEQTDQQATISPRRDQSAERDDNLNRLRTPDVEISDAKLSTTDVSASDCLDSEEEAKLSNYPAQLGLAGKRPAMVTSSDDETGDYGPFIEMNVEDLSAFASDEQSSGDFNVVKTVSPPFILQYKRESEEAPLDYEHLKPPVLSSVTTISDMDEEDQDYYNEILKEARKRRKKRAKDRPHQLINISPHDAFSAKQLRKEEKERTVAKNKAKEVEKRKQLESQAANQANFYAFARQLKTINYALSSEKCMDEGWTVKPQTPEPPLEPAKEFFVQETGANILSGKVEVKDWTTSSFSSFLNNFSDEIQSHLSKSDESLATVCDKMSDEYDNKQIKSESKRLEEVPKLKSEIKENVSKSAFENSRRKNYKTSQLLRLMQTKQALRKKQNGIKALEKQLLRTKKEKDNSVEETSLVSLPEKSFELKTKNSQLKNLNFQDKKKIDEKNVANIKQKKRNKTTENTKRENQAKNYKAKIKQKKLKEEFAKCVPERTDNAKHPFADELIDSDCQVTVNDILEEIEESVDESTSSIKVDMKKRLTNSCEKINKLAKKRKVGLKTLKNDPINKTSKNDKNTKVLTGNKTSKLKKKLSPLSVLDKTPENEIGSILINWISDKKTTPSSNELLNLQIEDEINEDVNLEFQLKSISNNNLAMEEVIAHESSYRRKVTESRRLSEQITKNLGTFGGENRNSVHHFKFPLLRKTQRLPTENNSNAKKEINLEKSFPNSHVKQDTNANNRNKNALMVKQSESFISANFTESKENTNDSDVSSKKETESCKRLRERIENTLKLNRQKQQIEKRRERLRRMDLSYVMKKSVTHQQILHITVPGHLSSTNKVLTDEINCNKSESKRSVGDESTLVRNHLPSFDDKQGFVTMKWIAEDTGKYEEKYFYEAVKNSETVPLKKNLEVQFFSDSLGGKRDERLRDSKNKASNLRSNLFHNATESGFSYVTDGEGVLISQTMLLELAVDLSEQRYKRTFVQKHYDNGNIFLGIFPDGSGTVWYLSGNVAVSIVATEKQGKLIYIIHEDKDSDENPRIQAIFEPDGNCTCYYPDGNIRTNLNPFGGEYYSLRGERTKRWQWRDKETHVHAPPFQPITFGLSKQVGVRIIAQDSIFITFTDGRRSVRFNVGTKLRIKSGFPSKEDFVDLNSLLLQDRIVYVQTLLQRFYSTFQFPHSPRRAQIKLPHYLSNKLEKISKLRSSIEKLPPIKESVTSLGPTNQQAGDLLLPPIPSKPKRSKTRIQIKRNISKKPENQFAVTVN